MTHTCNPDALALRRWKLGHQAFHYILVGMINSIRKCRESLHFYDYRQLLRDVQELTQLYRAATSAFKYAAAFDQESYATVVRPTMMPPYVPEGFSGTLNLKHNQMKHALQSLQKEISPVLESHGSEPLKQAWQDLLLAKNENMKNHGLVCNRFVPGGRSLLREYYANTQEGDDNR